MLWSHLGILLIGRLSKDVKDGTCELGFLSSKYDADSAGPWIIDEAERISLCLSPALYVQFSVAYTFLSFLNIGLIHFF